MPDPDPNNPDTSGDGGDGNYFDKYDDATKGWLNNRGMDKMTPADALAASIKGHMSAEKSLGVPMDRRIDIPVDLAAEGAMDPIYNRLGRPDAADGYEFTNAAQDASDKVFDDWAREAFHSVGLSADNGDALYTSFKEFIAGTLAMTNEEKGIQAEANKVTLQREWGGTYEANVNLANAAVSKMGLTPEQFDQISDSLGGNEAMKLFQKIGAGFGEDTFVEDTGLGPSGPTTPEGARQEIRELKKDKGFTALYLAGDMTAKKRMKALHVLASGGT